MSRMKGILLCLLLLTALAPGLESGSGDGNEGKKYAGVVKDIDGKPVAGARVTLCETVIHLADESNETFVRDVTITGDDGTFRLTLGIENKGEYSLASVLAQKKGMASNWKSWLTVRGKSNTTDFVLVLGKPASMAGTIVDVEENPIEGATVTAVLGLPSEEEPGVIMGCPMEEFLTRTTAQDGRFIFSDLPEDATAEFIVSAPGRGTYFTGSFNADFPFSHAAGNRDIKITLSVEAVIEGKVVEKGSGKPVAGVKIIVGPDDQSWGIFCSKTVVTDEKGEFRAEGLLPGSCLLRVSSAWEEAGSWTAASPTVLAPEGKTTGNVTIELVPGGFLKVTVKNKETQEPVAGAFVLLVNAGKQTQGVTDKEGKVQMPKPGGDGTHLFVMKEGYQNANLDELPATSSDGETLIAVDLVRNIMVNGLALDENGLPVPGAVVKIMPYGFRNVTTDESGKFEVEWHSDLAAQLDSRQTILVRHQDRNLVAVAPLDPDGMEIKLTTGATIKGKVADEEGAAIGGARIMVSYHRERGYSSISRNDILADSNGLYAIPALPADSEFSITATARGFGRCEIHLFTGKSHEAVAAETIVLKRADLTVSGKVLDENGKPVPNISVLVSGSVQNSRTIHTDSNGRFQAKGICEGYVILNASTNDAKLSGALTVKGGEKDAVLTLGERNTLIRRDREEKKKVSLVGKPMPALDGTGLEAALRDAAGKRVVLCFFDVNQRPSRHYIKLLAGKAEQLAARNSVLFGLDLSGIDRAELENRIAALGISFPVGSAGAKSGKAADAWGIEGLPYLVVIDGSSKVCAVGVAQADLESELDKTGGK